jgi:hypothetical protein
MFKNYFVELGMVVHAYNLMRIIILGQLGKVSKSLSQKTIFLKRKMCWRHDSIDRVRSWVQCPVQKRQT